MKYLPLAIVLLLSCVHTVTWADGTIQVQNDTDINIDSVVIDGIEYIEKIPAHSTGQAYVMDTFGDKDVKVTIGPLSNYRLYEPLHTEIRGNYIIRLYGPVLNYEGDPRLFFTYNRI